MGAVAHLGLALSLLSPISCRFEVIFDDFLQGLHIDLQSQITCQQNISLSLACAPVQQVHHLNHRCPGLHPCL